MSEWREDPNDPNLSKMEFKIEGLNSTDGEIKGSGSNGIGSTVFEGKIYPDNKVRLEFTLKDDQKTTFVGTYDPVKKIFTGVESEDGFKYEFQLKVEY